MYTTSKTKMSIKSISLLLSFLVIFTSVSAVEVVSDEVRSISICIGEEASEVEFKAAQLLKNRILEKSQIAVDVGSEKMLESSNQLIVLLGRPDHHEEIRNQFDKHRIQKLSELAPGPEGFLLKRIKNQVVVAGTDDRGCLYGVGELLRQIEQREDHILVPDKLNIRSAPAFEIRGTQYGQSGVGIGLTILKKLVKSANGKVWFENKKKYVSGKNNWPVHYLLQK